MLPLWKKKKKKTQQQQQLKKLSYSLTTVMASYLLAWEVLGRFAF